MGMPKAADPFPPVLPTHFDPPASMQDAFVVAFGGDGEDAIGTTIIPTNTAPAFTSHTGQGLI
jgi:hypothetical protein